MRRLPGSEHGQAALEAAVALPLLLFLLFAVLDLATLLDHQARLQAVAREAARAGALGGLAACREAGEGEMALRFAEPGRGAVSCSEAEGAVRAEARYQVSPLSPFTRAWLPTRLSAAAVFRRGA